MYTYLLDKFKGERDNNSVEMEENNIDIKQGNAGGYSNGVLINLKIGEQVLNNKILN